MEARLGDHRYRHPRATAWGGLLERVFACAWLLRARRWLFRRLPFVRLASDVRDVVYLNWVVPASRVAHLVPSGLQLWQCDGSTVLTVLTYQHGHFGPVLPAWLRRRLPSPLQSNWRLYLEDGARPGGVLFVSNVMDSLPYVAGARLCSDALPTHLADAFQHEHRDDVYATRISSGTGSAPDLYYRALRAKGGSLPADFQRIFADWRAAVATLALREHAIAEFVVGRGLAMAGIDLPVDLDTVEPLTLDAEGCASTTLQALVEGAEPLCFVVPRVDFRVLWERELLLPDTTTG